MKTNVLVSVVKKALRNFVQVREEAFEVQREIFNELRGSSFGGSRETKLCDIRKLFVSQNLLAEYSEEELWSDYFHENYPSRYTTEYAEMQQDQPLHQKLSQYVALTCDDKLYLGAEEIAFVHKHIWDDL